MSYSEDGRKDYRIIDKNIDERQFNKIEKTSFEKKIINKNPFDQYDEFCDKLDEIKYKLLKKTSFAEMGCIVESTALKPIIGTLALDTCYGILFYDRVSKEGICGHAVPGSLTLVLEKMIKWLNGRNGGIEYMFVPGFRNYDRKDLSGLNELDDYLLRNLPKNIEMIPFPDVSYGLRLDQETLSYEFAFDTVNGMFVTEYVFFNNTEHNPRYIAPKRRV